MSCFSLERCKLCLEVPELPTAPADLLEDLLVALALFVLFLLEGRLLTIKLEAHVLFKARLLLFGRSLEFLLVAVHFSLQVIS